MLPHEIHNSFDATVNDIRSFIINRITGYAVTGEKLSHTEVMEAGKAAAGRMGELLAKVLKQL
jgi:purine-nucleoside phosphorylase